MPLKIIDWYDFHIPEDKFSDSHEKNRAYMREELVHLFLKENPGTGKGLESATYRYNVERAGDKIIYILRPAMLNYGFDFTVHVENAKFRPKGAFKDRPKHKEIHTLLESLHQTSEGKEIKPYIEDVYYCRVPDYRKIAGISIDGYSAELLLKTIKWLFLEQDITYWNFSGRAMFYGGISSI